MTIPDQFSEALNGFTWMLLSVLIFIMTWYFLAEWRAKGWTALRRDEAGAITIAMLAIVFGTFGNRLAFWLMRHFINHREGFENLVPYFVGTTLISTAILACGAACAIRVMGPDRCGHWIWFFSIVVSLVISIGMAL